MNLKSHAVIGEDNFANFFSQQIFFSLNRVNKFTEKGFDWLKKSSLLIFSQLFSLFFVKPVMRTV